MDENKLKTFYLSLSQDEREDYAARCGTTPGYIMFHLIRGSRMPGKKLLTALAEQSEGQVTKSDLLSYFYQ